MEILVLIQIIIILYIISSLSRIKYQLNLIMKHFDIKDQNPPMATDEEILEELQKSNDPHHS